MNIVIVESAAKAKAINKYLGSAFKVIASYGHIRDLPSKDGSVEPDKDFEMHWDVDGRAAKVVREIAAAVKGADKLILATDPDREGEAISWHILKVLEEKKALKKGLPIERVTFNAVTKQSVLDAMKAPRAIDAPLVEAYLARRALDYLVGFTLSPVLWRKLPGSRSAGRVQSVALRLVCDREREIEAFKTEEYWTIEALLATAKGEDVRARLTAIAGTALKKLDIKDGVSANAIKAAIENGDFVITSVDKKATRRNPAPPFTTSTLQQEASRKLGFSAKQTMNIAQRLYEGVDIDGETVGLITYMRTDGVQIIPEAIGPIRRSIEDTLGKRYVAPFIREYKTKAKNAQEAHEAVRPTDVSRRPEHVARHLQRDQARLYELIWKRAVASQMASAELEQTTAEIEVKGRDGKVYGLRATGSVVLFDGFLKLYEEGRDEEDEESRRLPPLAQGDHLKDRGIDAKQHFTEPPPRYTEATLVKKMEELGIGRPSTYASTLAVLEDRGYVRIDRKRLIPEDKGRLVTAFLEAFFKRYVEYDFTADLEEKLDLISDHQLDWKQVLRDFWKDFTGAVDETKELRVSDVLEALNELLGPHIFPDKGDGSDPRACPSCGEGRLSLKTGKFGAFIGCSNYPECRFTRQLADTNNNGEEAANPDGKLLGYDPDTGLAVTLRTGRFGAYVQLGEQGKDKEDKPKRSSIPKGVDAASVDLEKALQLLSLPREVGLHPETQKPIVAGLGRYGPFILHDGMYANLESVEDVFTIGLNRAVTILAEKAAGGGKSRFQRGKPTVLKDLGAHPDGGGNIQVLSGRYGPYINYAKINANVPKGKEPTAVTVEEAIALLAERAAKGGGKTAKGRKAAKPAKAAAEKSAEAKPAKKAAAKPKKAAAKKAAPSAEKPAGKAAPAKGKSKAAAKSPSPRRRDAAE
ncbi:type I DNA topoisomerase [Hyphomicrobium sp. CS1BSMeth3]|uniref:type I DNA topoisomerase n=1 Tax=Hyphomicrobium sp. CS1BSMeth3 TaxID=1892844 RepID=UPI0009316471|nr:type I DNA topoisomerase [Hyphomicrobium sp. CS1BSMeth3]